MSGARTPPERLKRRWAYTPPLRIANPFLSENKTRYPSRCAARTRTAETIPAPCPPTPAVKIWKGSFLRSSPEMTFGGSIFRLVGVAGVGGFCLTTVTSSKEGHAFTLAQAPSDTQWDKSVTILGP